MVNGNTPEDALAAWRHVRGVFRAEDADVLWVWSVNVAAPVEPLFPGDDDVDWIGLDGYNGGAVPPWGGWRSPSELLGPDFEALQRLSDRPLLLTEVGSVESGGDKAAWTADLFAVCREAGVAGLVWFDYRKEADWRVASSPGALAAFRAAARRGSGVTPSPPVPDRLRR